MSDHMRQNPVSRGSRRLFTESAYQPVSHYTIVEDVPFIRYAPSRNVLAALTPRGRITLVQVRKYPMAYNITIFSFIASDSHPTSSTSNPTLTQRLHPSHPTTTSFPPSRSARSSCVSEIL